MIQSICLRPIHPRGSIPVSTLMHLMPILIVFWLGTSQALAVEVCELPPVNSSSPAAQAIVRTACEEHRLWGQPFINRHGRIAKLGITESESDTLADQKSIAWQQVALYWRESSTLAMTDSAPGSSSCVALDNSRNTANDCRAFLLDTPWSAAFISWVMTRVGLAGFTVSPSHITYIRASYLDASSPYRFTDPGIEKPKAGDLLCRIRGRPPVGYAGLRAALDAGRTEDWLSHCDIVVAANVNGDRTLHLIGGNVSNTVMMRKLPLDRKGRLQLSRLQLHQDQECTPAQENNCNSNRGDWAALLKLRPDVALAPPESQTATPYSTLLHQ
ncbi:DUF2272 domain-containing protein [Xylella fastidiosa]|uniref:DUF2272 domain-containing protein n=2 Tax=Xylella fastidiosa TaxID=2371 RepID=A0ABC8AHH4_XYLFS|nr:DUF2272 domain-containing protein [Xylella fastidiosa]